MCLCLVIYFYKFSFTLSCGTYCMQPTIKTLEVCTEVCVSLNDFYTRPCVCVCVCVCVHGCPFAQINW